MRDGEPVVLAPVQVKVLNDWWRGKFNVLTASRGFGKTFLAALYIALKIMLYPNMRLGIFGPAFRQSKFVFAEFEKFYNASPLLQECVARPPTVQNDQAICYMKPIAPGIDPNFLKALPVGSDGAKIRGERFSCFILDECAQMPETVFRSAIKPMLSTSVSPMKKVKLIAEMKEKYGSNFNPDMLEGENGYTVITSGYYQFNYWWQEILNMWFKIKNGSRAHTLNFVPYTDLPDGFLDMSIVMDAMHNDPRHVFLTEWCADWVADSEGAFPMSLLESARDESVTPIPGRPLSGKARYVFGVDVARERDSTAIVVIELGYPCKLVWISELEETPFPEQAEHLFSLIHRFDPISIYMDSGGGGKSLRDSLADPESVGVAPSMKVIEDDASPYHSGKRILKMCDFSPAFIEDINNNTKTLLEQAAIKLPTSNNPIEKLRTESKGKKKEVDLVQVLINQTASIVITPTGSSGRLRYDLPKNAKSSGGAEKANLKVRKKDIYTAFVLACSCAYDLAYKPIEDKKLVQTGVIKEINDADPVTATMGSASPRYTMSSNRRAGRLPTQGSQGPQRRKLSNGIIITRNGRKR